MAPIRWSLRGRRARATVVGAAALLLPLLWPAAPLDAQLPAVATEAPLDVRQGVSFHALVRPETVYVGQQANYQVGVFLGDDVRARLRRNPEFVPPEMSGMLAYELPVTHGVVPGRGRGRFEVHVFERAVFPLMPGAHQVPPARLSYSLPLTRQFFSREESHVMRSEPVRVVAIATPAAGRPVDFDGVVASGLRVDAVVRDDTTARVGDPLLLTLRVSGRGNVNLFPRPRLALGWAQAVPADERVTLDSSSRVVAGTKEFDWLVTPRQAGRAVVPVVRYPYFDPYTERYLLAVTRPETLAVAPGTLAALDSTPDAPRPSAMPLRQRYRGEQSAPPSRSGMFWLAAAAFPLPALVLRLRRRAPRRRPEPDAAARLAGLGEGAALPAPRQVRTAYLRALAARLGRRALPVSLPGALERLLRREGVSAVTAADAERLLGALDTASYAGADGARGDEAGAELARRATASYAVVDAEARRRGPTVGRVVPLVLLGVAAAVGVVQAAQSTPEFSPAALFREGVRSYDARHFGDAAELFSAAARRAPRAADAWANLGTAAWAAGDTARAAIGWQRALRLEPVAADVRGRLALLPSEQLLGWAAVPPVPPALVEWLALAAWLAAWAFAAARLRRPRRHGAAAAYLAGGIALLLGGGAVLLDERLAARDLAVVHVSSPLRSTPALLAAPVATARVGAVARIDARAGAWTRVETVEGTGWIAASQLRSLARE